MVITASGCLPIFASSELIFWSLTVSNLQRFLAARFVQFGGNATPPESGFRPRVGYTSGSLRPCRKCLTHTRSRSRIDKRIGAKNSIAVLPPRPMNAPGDIVLLEALLFALAGFCLFGDLIRYQHPSPEASLIGSCNIWMSGRVHEEVARHVSADSCNMRQAELIPTIN